MDLTMESKIRSIVVTVSDTRKANDDQSGPAIRSLLMDAGIEVVEILIVQDDLDLLQETLAAQVIRQDIDLIVTTGGTGFGPRDNTPEATRAVIDREASGLAEAMRRETALKTPLAMLSRGVCGIKEATLIINLPGSPTAARECFEVIQPVLGHAISLIRGHKPH